MSAVQILMSVVQLCCRCFMSAGSPAWSPLKSRMVEAVCIRLCDVIMQPLTDSRPDGSTRYVSRWHQILEACNRVRARLFNSLELLEGTDLALFVINEATHPASLVQAAGTAQGGSAVAAGNAGACQATVHRAAAASLAEPPFSGRPPTPPGLSAHRRHQWPGDREAPSHLIVRHRCADRRRSGIAPSPAGLRRRRPIRARPTSPTRTRAPFPRVRKTPCCQKCHQPTGSVGHSKYKGQIYCPYIPGQIPREEWLALRRTEDVEKKAGQHG